MARKRSKRLLLVPFLVPIFLIGYIMSVIGESRATQTKHIKPVPKPAAKQNDVEMGLIDEIAEPQIAKKP